LSFLTYIFICIPYLSQHYHPLVSIKKDTSDEIPCRESSHSRNAQFNFQLLGAITMEICGNVAVQQDYSSANYI
jgi:hypothetical protein